jgi:hypothetical protein
MAERDLKDAPQGPPAVLPYTGAAVNVPTHLRWPRSPLFWIAWLASSVAIGIVLYPCFGLVLAGLVLVGARQAPLVWATIGMVVAAMFVGRDLTAEWRRPMFHNHYGRNDRMFWNEWYPLEIPSRDPVGNIFNADHRLNLMLVALTPRPGEEDYYRYAIDMGQRSTTDVHTDAGTVTIPRVSNQWIVVFPDSTQAQFPLGQGEAKRLHEVLAFNVPDDVLSRLEEQMKGSPQGVAFIRGCRLKQAQVLGALGGPATRPATRAASRPTLEESS